VAIEHLTDSVLQDYLDGNLGDRESEIKTHLESCSLCSARLEQYKLLYSELEIDNIPTLSPDFSKAVMSKIAQVDLKTSGADDKKRTFFLPAFVYAICGIVAAIASILYFVNLEPLMRAFRLPDVSDYLNRVIISKIGLATADLGFNFSLVLMVITTLAIIGFVDFVVRHYKHRTASFMV